MNTKTRFVLGGIGGIAPILLFFINLDFERYVEDATTWKTIGYIVRAVFLFLLGGFVAYLHETETKRITLFLVGVSAPSLIAGYLSTASLNLTQGQSSPKPQKKSLLFLVPSAHAQSPTQERPDGVKRFTLPLQSKGSQFLEGLLGMPPKNVWFVIFASSPNVDKAKEQAATLNKIYKESKMDYKADVYAPYADIPYYTVVIGAHLTQEEAKALRGRAVRDGFPKDIYYRTFRNLPPPI
jgi:hypothetical protein